MVEMVESEEGVVEGIKSPREQTPSSCLRLAEKRLAMVREARERKGGRDVLIVRSGNEYE